VKAGRRALALPLALSASLSVALLGGCATRAPTLAPASAQSAEQRAAEQLRQAEADYKRGDPTAAAAGYRAVLQLQPENSRALFRLGQLAPKGSAEAIGYLKRYTAQEPADPWGYMALGDAQAQAGPIDAALAQYAQARRLAPDEPEVAAGELRILRDAGRIDALIERLAETVARRPDDASAWIELGRARQRAGQHAEAAQAFRRAHQIAPSARTEELMDGALSRAAPLVRPYAGRAEDSDDNEVTRLGADLLLPVGPRTRLGLNLERAQVADPFTEGDADRVALLAEWRPSHAWRIGASAGIVRLAAPQQQNDDRATGHLRVRWRESLDSVAADLNVQRQPLLASPALLAQPVDFTRVRGVLDLPMTLHWIARLQGESARFDESVGYNTRVGGRGGVVYRQQPGLEFQVSAGSMAYERASTAPYSAYERNQSVELGMYLEVDRFWPVVLAVDTAAGMQRITRFNQPAGDWKGTFRWWSSVGWEVSPGAELALEIEHDNTIEQQTVTTSTDQWRSTSVMLSLRLGVWRQDRAAFVAMPAAERRRTP
jgi:cytochrome c-type biogenesis protein CcmH/NrfG